MLGSVLVTSLIEMIDVAETLPTSQFNVLPNLVRNRRVQTFVFGHFSPDFAPRRL